MPHSFLILCLGLLFLSPNTTPQRKTLLFSGYKFNVLNSNESSIEIANQSFEIDQLLAMHSGTLSKNQKEPTILIASKPVAHAKLLIQSSTFDRDILRPTWIAVCIQAHAVVPPAPKSVLFTQILQSHGLHILTFSPPPPPLFSFGFTGLQTLLAHVFGSLQKIRCRTR